MSRRTVLTELGPDDGALRDQERDSILFDLGIDALQTDLCVRIADDAVAAQLRCRPVSLRARQSRDRRDPR
jgi:hypothetical protein